MIPFEGTVSNPLLTEEYARTLQVAFFLLIVMGGSVLALRLFELGVGFLEKRRWIR
jgi:hypothetical protein